MLTLPADQFMQHDHGNIFTLILAQVVAGKDLLAARIEQLQIYSITSPYCLLLSMSLCQ